jgi:hypothetical protein
MSPVIEIIYKIIKLVFGFPPKVNDFILYAESIYNKMNGNTRYSSLSTKLAELLTAIGKLYDEQALCTMKPPKGNTLTRNNYLAAVKMIIRDLGNSVQIMANADLPNAETIITDAGFAVKKSGGKRPIGSTITDGPVSGSVTVTAPGKGPHLWRVSSDNESFTIKTGSKKSTITMYNFPLKQMLYVQSGQVTDDGSEPAWSQSMSILVR